MKSSVDSNHWKEMSAGSFRRVDAELKHNVFWFRDIHGAYGIRYSLNNLFKREMDEQLEGLSLLRRNKASKGELFILLSNNEDWEIFLVLCQNLINLSERYTEETPMIVAVENRISRWKKILKQGRSNTMSREKQMGLITELLCLKDILAPKIGINGAIISWVGCESDKQDFITENALLEVKSFQITKGGKITISSLEQLNSPKEPLFLICYGVSINEDGLTINDLVDDIYAILNDQSFELNSIFENKLFEYGYLPQINEDKYLINLSIESFNTFEVRESFPKLNPNNIDSRIIKAKYSIDIGKCHEFLVDINTII
jgi:hypothetical protein